MAKFDLRPIMEFSVVIILTEEEARALQHISGYNSDSIVDAIDNNVTNMKEYRRGMKSLLSSIRDSINKKIAKIDLARKVSIYYYRFSNN